MKVLVACEFSGRVRDAFIMRGHDAVSCDLIDTEVPGPHIIGDALEAVYTVKPDLLIAHPPCTFLANSGARWLYGGKGQERDEARWTAMYDGAEFFARLLMAPVPYIAVENPIMHRHGKSWIKQLAAFSPAEAAKITTVQPWQFGTPETKATQLWLLGLPALVPTDIVDGRTPRVHFMSPGPNRGHERSRTDPNIAAAMARQWGDYVTIEQGRERAAIALRQAQVDRLARDLEEIA